MASTTTTLQTLSIATALVAAGGIATLSLFDIPEIQSQPASRALPMTRWLFSRGSHIFPSAALLASAGFASLAYRALPAGQRTIVQLLKNVAANNTPRVNGYIAAAILAASIGPFTTMVMLPTNFRLIEKNEQLGGARSQASAKANTGSRTARESVDGQGDPNEFTDLSGPQTRTKIDSTPEDDEEVRQLLGKFSALNAMRAVLLGLGGIVGLVTALS